MENCAVCRTELIEVKANRKVVITNMPSVPEELRAPDGELPICDECWDRSVQVIKARMRNAN